MRLTLRTMLACLDADDRLDPADVEELSQKIEQSPQATMLAQRVRRLVQHARVGTPRVDAKGNGTDANSVAEYLDNTLASEKIADFEHNCIHSDVRLAEVAACHQILVLVLEQPAEVAPHVRERMYRLGAESVRRVEDGGSEVRPTASGGVARLDRPAETSAAATPKPKPEVPEYLRAGRRPSIWPLALAALLAFVAVAISLRAMGPFDSAHPLAKLLGGQPAEQPSDEKPLALNTNGEGQTIAPPAVVEKSETEKTEVAKSPPDDLPPGETIVPEDPPEPETTTPVEPLPEVTPVEDRPVPEVTETKPVEPPVPAADIGRFSSEDQLLVRFSDTGEFSRVPSRASLFAGDDLISLPATRPQILLANNVQLTIAGEARLALDANGASGAGEVVLMQGRLLASSVGKADAKLVLDLGHVTGVVTFAAADSEIAIEVRQYLPPGANPASPGATVPIARLYATRGSVQWQEGMGDQPAEVIAIESGHVRNYVGELPGETVALAALPDWIDGKNISDIDRRAARTLEGKLGVDRDLILTLQELAAESERQAETRSLAIRSLGYLGQFESYVSAFNDEQQRAFWASEFDALRDMLVRSPAAAEAIHATLVKQRGDAAGDLLYRMLWGYSPDDLKNGMAAELVKALDDEALDVRVLAFENLRRITGSTQLYQPQFNAARRKTPVAQWNERLKGGEIVYKVAPAPIVDPKPVPMAPPVRPTRGLE